MPATSTINPVEQHGIAIGDLMLNTFSGDIVLILSGLTNPRAFEAVVVHAGGSNCVGKYCASIPAVNLEPFKGTVSLTQ